MAKPEAELKKAIRKGDIETVRKVLDDGLDVNALLPAKVTALEFALQVENRDIVDTLLQSGAMPREQKKDNLLLNVPKFRDLELLKGLVSCGADIHKADGDGYTPLMMATSEGHFESFAWLVDQGADLTQRNKSNETVTSILHRSRKFYGSLIDGAGPENAKLFQTILTDLDRIEALIRERLSDEELAETESKPRKQAEPSTFWQLDGEVELKVEVSPFPFQSKTPSTLTWRLGYHGKIWEDMFRGSENIQVRVVSGDNASNWQPLSLDGRDGDWLTFSSSLHLPAGSATVELQFDAPSVTDVSEVGGWTIEVT